MNRDETFVHVAIRKYLKEKGWKLIAGQYPGGSDDELHVLNIYDPELARDESPDHRRHSLGKLVPDLMAYKNDKLIVVEAKPNFSIQDRKKLTNLFNERKDHFLSVLNKFAIERKFDELIPVEKLELIPVLAFLAENDLPANDGPSLLVVNLDSVNTKNLIV